MSNQIQLRQGNFKWLNREISMILHPPGDSTSDTFGPPGPLSIYPYFIQDRDGIFLDIGTHIGTVSIFASFLFAEVWSFEPEERNLAILHHNIRTNDVNNIKVIDKAVSDYCGETEFYIEHSVNTGRNSILERPNSRKVAIDVISIDSLFSDSRPKISYIKIDVEGLEPQVVEGLKETIRNQDPQPVLEIEFAPSRWNEEYFKKFVSFISDNNYVPFIKTQGFICPIRISILVDLFETWKDIQYDSWFDMYLLPEGKSRQNDIMKAWAECRNTFMMHRQDKA